MQALRYVIIAACLAVTAWLWWLMIRPATGPVLTELDRLGELHNETQAAFNQEPTSDVIVGSILPRYEQARMEASDDALPYIDAMIEAWTLAADSIRRQNIVVTGEAVAAFEHARELLRDMGADVTDPPPSIRDEIALLLAADSKLHRELAALSAGELPDPALADAVETDVLPEWELARERFTAAAASPPEEYQRCVSRLLEYAALRSEAIQLQVDAVRELDDAKYTRGGELLEEARQIRETVMRDGLTE